MKTLRRLCAVFVLTLTLSLSVFAGDMETGIAAPPSPPDSQAMTAGQMDTTVAGQMDTGVTGDMSTGVAATDPATEVALNLLQNLLSLF